MIPRLSFFVSLASLLLLPSCGGGGGDGSSGATADVLIGDAPSDDLLSFSAVIQSVRLQRDDLTFTGDLVGTLEVEFLGLNGLAFLVKGRIPAGTYTAVEIGFAPGQYHAKADDSSPVTIVAAQNTYLAALPAPLVVTVGQYVRLSVDLDLLNSLTGTVASGTLAFSPHGSCGSSDGSDHEPFDELKGTVASASAADATVLVDGFVGDPPVSIGRVSVHVSGSTLLFDDDNSSLTFNAFFARLVPGTRLEVHGELSFGGLVEATRIEIEDNGGGGGGDSGVRIRGIVTALGGSQLSLRIAQIKDGASVANPVLATLPNPDVIAVSFGAGTTFEFDSGVHTNSGSLAVGQEVTARFSAFTAPPFPAREIEIDDTPGFHGTLTGTTPGELTMHLDASDAAVSGGLVAGPTTDVRVTLGSAPLTLDVPGAPRLVSTELARGLELELHGRLSGSPDAPVIAAERVLVRPGFLRSSALTNVAVGGGNFVVDGGEHVDPFGHGVTPGPLLMWIEDGCTFEGDVSSRAEFEARYGTQGFVPATLDVRGLANGSANEIRAFAVRVTH